MPTDGCSVHIQIVIINPKLKGAEQDSVPYMMKVIVLRYNRVNANRVKTSISD